MIERSNSLILLCIFVTIYALLLCDGLSSDLRYLQITFGPPNVNVTRYRSCSKCQEFLDQTWRETVPAKWCCRYLGLHNNGRWFEPSATITSSMCSAKLLKKRCRSVTAGYDNMNCHTWSIGSDWRAALLPGGRELTTIGSCCGYIRNEGRIAVYLANQNKLILMYR